MFIINWCNENSGFISAVLSIVGIILSIIAIVISIQTARLPYKKKLLLTAGSYFTNTTIGYHVTATNVGNRRIKITKLGFAVGDKVLVNPKTLCDSQITLESTADTSQYFSSIDFERAFSNFNGKIYAYAEDNEGTKYKKFFCRSSEIRK